MSLLSACKDDDQSAKELTKMNCIFKSWWTVESCRKSSENLYKQNIVLEAIAVSLTKVKKLT